MKLVLNKIKRFKIVVLILRLVSPGYTRCSICGLPWKYCQEKSIGFGGTGYFSTCKYCWDNSSLWDLKTAYLKDYNKYWSRDRLITIKELIDKVEEEFNNESIKRRKQKLKTLKKRTKKNKKMNVTLFKQD